MRISVWSSDVCSSDLLAGEGARRADEGAQAQRSVLLTLACGPGTTAKAARFARPPHPALRATFSRRREKGCFPSAGGRRAAFLPQTGEGLLSFRRREMGLPGGSGSRRPYLPGGGPKIGRANV